MTVGLEVYNEDGRLQIALGSTNYCLVQKGTVSVPFLASYPVQFTITPTVAYDAIAISCANLAAVPKSIFPTTKAANTPQKFACYNLTGATDVCTWYAFRSYRGLTPPTGSGPALELYNEDGTLSFSSRLPNLLKGMKLPITSNAAQNLSVPSSKRFAFLTYGTTLQVASAGGSSFLGYAPSARHNLAQNRIELLVNTWVGAATSTSGLPASIYTGGIIAADVTGY